MIAAQETLGQRRTALAIHLRDHRDDDDGWRELFKLCEFMVRAQAVRHRSLLRSGGGDDDLMQAGNIGIVRAVERFDPGRDRSFGTLAEYHIRHEVQATAAGMGSGMVPRVLRLVVWRGDKASRCRRSVKSVAAARECEARSSERLGFTTRDYAAGIDIEDRREPFPIDPDDLAFIERGLSALDDRSAEIIVRRFGLGDAEAESMQAIAAKLGITRQRVHQIEREALAKLRDLAGA